MPRPPTAETISRFAWTLCGESLPDCFCCNRMRAAVAQLVDFPPRSHASAPARCTGMVEDYERCYRAVTERDARFDGRFVTAVRTTGIYCRPSCPARTPLARNVSFFAGPEEARAAGYRACKRCHP